MRTKSFHFPPLLFSLLIVFFSANNSFAEEVESNVITEAQKSSIAKHCDAIKDTLKATQRSDSHARTYLGSIYESALNQFITPLNVRLIKDNRSVAEFTELQAKFVSTRTDFNSSFITYSKSLEDLINTDCANSPQDFYSKLTTTRQERAIVDGHAKKLEQLISKHKQKVTSLEQTL